MFGTTLRRNRTAAFTLIELLVVIAIIAILAAILFPVFAQAREKARATVCLSNAKQVGTAVLMYGQDYDETIIPWFVGTGLPRDDWRHDLNSWTQNLQPYIKNGKPVDPPPGYGPTVPPIGMFVCPSHNPANMNKSAEAPDCDGVDLSLPANGGYYPPLWYHAQYGIGFGVQCDPSGGGPWGNTCAGTKSDPVFYFAGSDVRFGIMTLAMINRPAETVEVSDGMTGVLNNGKHSFGTTMGCEAANAHSGGGTHIFTDGHAKWIARNSERYLDQGTDGLWYKRYYSVNR
jgi:prepilin-type N-terminal cleavage/methylation domain-containing protein